MPKKPQPANHPNHSYNIVTQIPGWLKNQLLEHVKKHNTTTNKWIATQILEGIRRDQGLPPPPPATNPIPNRQQTLRSYLTGEKLLNPCGQTTCQIDIQQIQNFQFCKTCGIRVS